MPDGLFGEQHEAYAGVELTFCRVPLLRDPEELREADVAMVGAPFDLGTSFRPGARFGPRAIRAAEDVGAPANRPHMEVGIDPFEVMKVVDAGDARIRPTIDACHRGLHEAVGQVLASSTVPVVLGGDHSLSLPVMRALRERFGVENYRVIHFDTHADTAMYKEGATTEHAAPFYRAVEEGQALGKNITQIGLRGAWPFPREFDWMRGQGISWRTMDEVEERGLATIVQEAVEQNPSLPVYLTVDIDVLDPAFAPGTGTPEPGGLSTRELLRAVRMIGTQCDLCAMDLVEVSPPYDPSGITSLAAHRVILETLSAMALRKSGVEAKAQRPA